MSVIDRCFAFALFCCVSIPVSAWGADTPALKLAAVMEFELIDDMRDYERPEDKEAQNRRIGLISNALREELLQRGMYRLADNSAASKLIADLKAQQELRDCNGCEIEIGEALGADVVAQHQHRGQGSQFRQDPVCEIGGPAQQ